MKLLFQMLFLAVAILVLRTGHGNGFECSQIDPTGDAKPCRLFQASELGQCYRFGAEDLAMRGVKSSASDDPWLTPHPVPLKKDGPGKNAHAAACPNPKPLMFDKTLLKIAGSNGAYSATIDNTDDQGNITSNMVSALPMTLKKGDGGDGLWLEGGPFSYSGLKLNLYLFFRHKLSGSGDEPIYRYAMALETDKTCMSNAPTYVPQSQTSAIALESCKPPPPGPTSAKPVAKSLHAAHATNGGGIKQTGVGGGGEGN